MRESTGNKVIALEDSTEDKREVEIKDGQNIQNTNLSSTLSENKGD